MFNNKTNDQLNNAPPKRRRGRPRKNKVATTPPKKRGRKPKQIVAKPKIYKPRKKNTDLILHLPITRRDLLRYSNKFTTNDDTVSDTSETDNTFTNKDIFTITDDISENSDSEELYDKTICSKTELVEKLKEKDEIIEQLQKKLVDYKNIITESEIMGINNNKVITINTKLISVKDGKQIIANKTSIACWWCTHNFDTHPYFVPEKCIDGKYHVLGCFCSYQCAGAFIFDRFKDYKVWERYSLLKKLYNIENKEPILAPSRYIFTKFGGEITIEEYRKNLNKNNKKYRMIIPPLIPITPLVERTSMGSRCMIKTSFKNDGLLLKRSKPLPNSNNTLAESMGIFGNK